MIELLNVSYALGITLLIVTIIVNKIKKHDLEKEVEQNKKHRIEEESASSDSSDSDVIHVKHEGKCDHHTCYPKCNPSKCDHSKCDSKHCHHTRCDKKEEEKHECDHKSCYPKCNPSKCDHSKCRDDRCEHKKCEKQKHAESKIDKIVHIKNEHKHEGKCDHKSCHPKCNPSKCDHSKCDENRCQHTKCNIVEEIVEAIEHVGHAIGGAVKNVVKDVSPPKSDDLDSRIQKIKEQLSYLAHADDDELDHMGKREHRKRKGAVCRPIRQSPSSSDSESDSGIGFKF